MLFGGVSITKTGYMEYVTLVTALNLHFVSGLFYSARSAKSIWSTVSNKSRRSCVSLTKIGQASPALWFGLEW